VNNTASHEPESSPSGSKQVHVTEETIYDLPPSSKLVLKVLEQGETLTQREIADETRLPQRTVRNSLKRLIEVGLVEERPYFRDARQSIYHLLPNTIE
jgi:DNA-binding MarR family transcriptional regulator